MIAQNKYPTKEESMYDEKVKDGDEGACLVCFENKRVCVIWPCKHFSLCISCAAQKKIEDCPQCRTKITCIERLYF